MKKDVRLRRKMRGVRLRRKMRGERWEVRGEGFLFF